MAKYTITHKCGHKETHQIGGKVADRDNKAEWLADRLCYDCYKAEQAKEKEEVNQINAEANKEAGLPELTGTEKQIAWAETIRATIMAKADEMKEKAIFQMGHEDEKFRKAAEIVLDTIEQFKNRTEASWWIENHKNPTGSEIADAARKAFNN